MPIKHRFVSTKPVGSDRTRVGSPEWNDEFVATGGADGQPFVRNSAHANGAEFSGSLDLGSSGVLGFGAGMGLRVASGVLEQSGCGPTLGSVIGGSYQEVLLGDGYGPLGANVSCVIVPSKTDADSDWGNYYGRKIDISIAPAASAAGSHVWGERFIIATPDNNTYALSSLACKSIEATLNGSAIALDGYVISVTVGQNATVSLAKGIWASAINYGTGAIYAHESYCSNYAVASTLVNSRLSMENQHVEGYGSANPSVAAGYNVLASYNNATGCTTSTFTSYGFSLTNVGPLTTGYGINFSIVSNAGGIGTLKWININAPVGAITNHYGIYMADQTVGGATINYALYSAGGKWHRSLTVYADDAAAKAAGLAVGDEYFNGGTVHYVQA